MKINKKIATKILKNKKITDKKVIRMLAKPQKNNLYEPYAYKDMGKAVQLIKQAIADKIQITIYGDYDVDGITATSIVYETLQEMGAKVNYYIPDRFKDGYGANPTTYKKLIDKGTQLFITVDNGIQAFDAIDYGNEHGVKTIVTDHHEVGSKLPNADAIIHARANNDYYPFKELSGAGVAFKLSTVLLGYIPKTLLELACLGIVADLVSMTDENHTIVKFGLITLKKTKREGLIDLYDDLGIDRESITEQTISFKLAPVLNSLGRMGDANVGVELLTTKDKQRASVLANFAKEQNEKRKELVNELTDSAFLQAEGKLDDFDPKEVNGCPITIVALKADEKSRGVAGIVASKLVEFTDKPSLCLIIDENGVAKGSGRSVDGFNLFDALNKHVDLMENFGGHEMACGITIKNENIPQLTRLLTSDGLKLPSEDENKQKGIINSAISLHPSQANLEAYNSVRFLAPYGTDYNEPQFSITGKASNPQVIGKDKTHLKFNLGNLTCLAFGKADEISKLDNEVTIIGRLSLNVFMGRKNVQLMVDEIIEK